MQYKEKNPDWIRIECVLESIGFTSVNGFAAALGLKHAENLFQIKKGHHGISRKLAEAIHARFPQFTMDWLRFGLVTTEERRQFSNAHGRIPVPYYDFLPLSFEFSLDKGRACFLTIPDKWFFLPKSVVQGAEFAMCCQEESLMPLFFKRTILLIRPVTEQELIYGSPYILQTKHEVLLRLVEPGHQADKLNLVSSLPAQYPMVSVPRSNVRQYYAVCSSFRQDGV